jgi:hypothetical protein
MAPTYPSAVTHSAVRDRGREYRSGTAGVEGNARLTGALGAVVFVLLAVEGATILRVRQLIDVHVFVGALLIPPLLVKMSSAIYRFARYYAGSPEYVRRGPPAPLLRVLGPIEILTTVAVFGTGIALIEVSPSRAGSWLFLHKASFILWFGVTTLHVLGHLRETLVLAYRDWGPGSPTGRSAAGRARRARAGLVALSLVAGVGLGAALLPSAAAWR